MRARARCIAVVVLALAFFAPALGETSSHVERSVVRTVASPLPVEGQEFLADNVRWRVIVPDGVVVLVDATGTSPFFLRFRPASEPAWERFLPAMRATALLAAGEWLVEADPFVGAAMRIDVTFDGYSGDVGGAAAAFELRDVFRRTPCVLGGPCLP